MSHYRHPRLAEPVAFEAPPAIRCAADIARNYYINSLRHGRHISAHANPYQPGTRHHEVWFAALLTEASDHLDLLAADRAAGSFTIHG